MAEKPHEGAALAGFILVYKSKPARGAAHCLKAKRLNFLKNGYEDSLHVPC